MAADKKNGPGLGKKDLNIPTLLLNSYRFSLLLCTTKIAAAATTAKVKRIQTVESDQTVQA